jgi:hypothetical protein
MKISADILALLLNQGYNMQVQWIFNIEASLTLL